MYKRQGRIKFTQPHLIDQILTDLHLTQPGTKSTPTPALLTKVLQPDDDGRPFDGSFHYRSVIGKLNFLEKSTRPDIAYAVHQCARFMENPKMSHGHAVKHIGRYLLGTRDHGMIFDPKSESVQRTLDPVDNKKGRDRVFFSFSTENGASEHQP